MKIFRNIANRNLRAVLCLCVAVLSQMAAAQVWVGSTGIVDESSTSTYQFTGQAAFVRSSVATGTTLLRYNVGPAGDILKPVTNACCEARALMVRFLDNGSAAHVVVTLKRYDVKTGHVTTLLSFDSDHYPARSGFQEPVPTIFDGAFFNFSFAEGPTQGPQDQGGCCVYYVDAKLIRSAPEGTPGLASIRLVRVLAP
jgi:hypothetical protein